MTRRSRLPRTFSSLAFNAACSVLLLLFTAPAKAAEISLPEARSRMRSSHEALKAAGYEVHEREVEVGAAKALLWPKLEANARVIRMDGPIVIDLEPVRQVILTLHPGVPSAAVPPFLLDVQDELFGRVDVRFTWPLFTGGKIAAARSAADARKADAEASLRTVDEGLSTELVRRYFGARLAGKARDVRVGVSRPSTSTSGTRGGSRRRASSRVPSGFTRTSRGATPIASSRGPSTTSPSPGKPSRIS